MANYKILVLVFFSALACTAAVRELPRNNHVVAVKDSIFPHSAADVYQDNKQDSSVPNPPAGGGIGGSIGAGGQGSAGGGFGLGGPGGSLGLGGATSGGLGGSFGFGPIDGGGLLPGAGVSGQVGGGVGGSIGLGPFGSGLGGGSGGANP